jgi:hypothetical protein
MLPFESSQRLNTWRLPAMVAHLTMKNKRTKFSDLPAGSRFEYEGHVYRKQQLNLACDENQRSIIFASDTEVQHRPQTSQESSDHSAKPDTEGD